MMENDLDVQVFRAADVLESDWIRNFGPDFYPSQDTDAAFVAAIKAFGDRATVTLMRTFGAEGEFWVASAQGVPGIGTAETAALALCRLILKAKAASKTA